LDDITHLLLILHVSTAVPAELHLVIPRWLAVQVVAETADAAQLPPVHRRLVVSPFASGLQFSPPFFGGVQVLVCVQLEGHVLGDQAVHTPLTGVAQGCVLQSRVLVWPAVQVAVSPPFCAGEHVAVCFPPPQVLEQLPHTHLLSTGTATHLFATHSWLSGSGQAPPLLPHCNVAGVHPAALDIVPHSRLASHLVKHFDSQAKVIGLHFSFALHVRMLATIDPITFLHNTVQLLTHGLQAGCGSHVFFLHVPSLFIPSSTVPPL
jgi:hypothetical protein